MARRLVVGLALFLAACGGESTLRGRVTDGSGTQAQVRGAVGAGKLGGSGTLAATSSVKVMSVGNFGALELVAEADVSASGEYQVEVPQGSQRLIVQAVNASGEVVASTLVEHTVGARTVAPPMDSETSVEAEVLVQLLVQGVALAEANAVDLRARINAEVAADVKASSDAAAELKALAEAVAAAQRARIESYAEQGIQVSQRALFEAQLDAAARLNAALDSGGTPAADAYARFHAELEEAERTLGVEAEEQASAESSASAAFRATVEVRLSASAHAQTRDSAVRAAASLEAHTSSMAIEAILRAGGAAAEVQAAAVQAGQAFRAQVSAATTASAAASAFAAYEASLTGSASVSGSVLGSYLGVNASNQTAVEGSLDVAANAAADLSGSFDAALGTLLSLTGAIDLDALARATVDSYQAYRASVIAQGPALSGFGAKGDVAVSLMVVAYGSFF